jgi:hypothetical protein
VIPLPRAWLLTSAMMVGTGAGLAVGVAMTMLVTARLRSDAVVGLVVGVPSVAGLILILTSKSRWFTALGVFLLAMAPAWFGALVAIEGASGV